MCQTRAKCAHKKITIPTEFERFRNKNAQQMPRSSLRLKPRIPELFSDRNSGHVQVVNQKTDLSPQKRAHVSKNNKSTCFERFRNKNAKQMLRSSLRLKPRIPELFSDRNSGHVRMVNQKNDLSPQRADTRGVMPKASKAHVAPS